MTEAIATNTRTQYRRHWLQFRDFCKELACPRKQEKAIKTLELWVAALSKQGVSYGSILTKLAAVRYHWRRSKKDATLSSHRLELMLNGLKKRKKTTRGKNPITTSHLTRLHKATRSLEKPMALTLRAMTALAFFGFLRPSELCISKSNHHLRRKDVRVSRNNKYCMVKFRLFKHSISPQMIRVDEQTQGPVKPVRTIKRYLDKSKAASCHQPLFDVTTTEFRNQLDKLCQSAGIKSTITPHCFRIGGATWASKQGWPDARIQQHGRWRSGAYRAYIKL